MRLSLRYRARKTGCEVTKTKPLCTLCTTRAPPGSDNSQSLLTWSNVKVMVRPNPRTGKLELKDGRSLNLQLNSAWLFSAQCFLSSNFSREKTASTCMQLLTCTRTNPARNNLSCNREYECGVPGPYKKCGLSHVPALSACTCIMRVHYQCSKTLLVSGTCRSDKKSGSRQTTVLRYRLQVGMRCVPCVFAALSVCGTL